MAYSSTKRLIKPFRGYGEHEVINMFAFDLETVNKGTFVKILGNGWKNSDDSLNITSATSVGASYSNVVSDRYSTTARVTTAGTGDANKVIGLLNPGAQVATPPVNKMVSPLAAPVMPI